MITEVLYNDQDKLRLIDFVNRLDLKRPQTVTIKGLVKKRSVKQSNLFWMYLQLIKDETGNDTATLHDYFCSKYLPWKIVDCFGSEVVKTTGTRNLNTAEFTKLIDDIRLEMSEEGIYLPLPDDIGWDDYYLKYGGR